jgi:hypothetical protein
MSSKLYPRQFFELPVEISLQCVELLPKRDLLAFCTTCKTALSITQPLLYRNVKLNIDFDSALPVDFTGTVQTQLFLLRRTLKNNSNLRKFIKVFELDFKDLASHWDIDDPRILGVAELLEFVGWFNSVKSFTMTFNFFQSSTEFDLGWRLFMQTVRNMPHLEELSLAGGSRLDHSTLLQLLHPLRLKFLQLNCLGPIWKLPLPRSQYPQVFHLELESLRDLEIEAGEDYADLSGLLPWCTKLQTLKLGDLALGVTSSAKSFTMQGLLAPINITLRELTLRFPSRIESKKMKLCQMRISELTSLHSLFLMDWMIGEEDQPFDIYDALFSGQLRKILWFYNEWSTQHRQLTISNIYAIKDAFSYAKKHECYLSTFVFEVKLQKDTSRYSNVKQAISVLEKELKNTISVVDCVCEYLT